ncbi:MAG: hypothetical protein PHW62_04435 [Candidatus Ratteibacteria bacterium]|nr:hypothetical protein [Candidatus Ratteibacteria bacterium]
MKKIHLALLAVAFISSLFFVQLSQSEPDEVKTFVGTIESLRIAPAQFRSGPPLWPFGMIEVKSDSGEKSNFLLVGEGEHATIFYKEDGQSDAWQNIKAKIGKKVEIKYAVTAETMRYANKQLALSVRYLSEDYVPQPTVSPPQTNAVVSAKTKEAKIFLGTVKDVSAVLGRAPNWTYNRINVIADNGDKADFFVMRSTVITDVNGDNLSGKRVKKGQKAEIKYSILTDSSAIINGQKGAVSIRYVPSDYVPQIAASNTQASVSSETTQPVVETTGQTGNTITGKVESIKRYMKSSPPKWEHAMLTVVADNGEKTIVYVIKATFVADASGKDMSKGGRFGVFSLKGGERIEVKYSTVRKDHNEAVSIHCLE